MLTSATDKSSSRPRLSRFWRKPWPLRTALGLFALSLVLPAVLFFGLQYRAALVEKQLEVEREGRQLAHSVAADVSREIAIKRAELSALATAQALRAGNYAAFHARATEALRDSNGWIGLLRGDGAQLLSTLVPAGTPLETARLSDLAQQAIRTGQPVESDLFVGRLGKRYVVNVFYPVGYGDLVLSSALLAEHLNDVLHRALPTGWLATLIDRTGAVIASSQNAEAMVGAPASAELWRHISAASEGSAFWAAE